MDEVFVKVFAEDMMACGDVAVAKCQVFFVCVAIKSYQKESYPLNGSFFQLLRHLS